VLIISCPVEYLHFGGNKADGRWQMAPREGTLAARQEGNDNCLGGHDILIRFLRKSQIT
jgi:hypothetical protein